MAFLKAVFDKGGGRPHRDIKSLSGRRISDGLLRICTERRLRPLMSNLQLHDFNWELVPFNAHLFCIESIVSL